MSKKINRQFSCSKMMLPEHRAGLQQHASQKQWEEDHRRPLFDEQRQEELQQILEQALLNRQSLKLTILNGSGYKTCRGIPLRSDPSAGLLFIHTGTGRTRSIRAVDVVCLEPE